MLHALTQAAAEYVGVMISNGIRAVGTFSSDVLRYAQDNPLVIVGGLVVLVFLWRLISRR